MVYEFVVVEAKVCICGAHKRASSDRRKFVRTACAHVKPELACLHELKDLRVEGCAIGDVERAVKVEPSLEQPERTPTQHLEMHVEKC